MRSVVGGLALWLSVGGCSLFLGDGDGAGADGGPGDAGIDAGDTTRCDRVAVFDSEFDELDPSWATAGNVVANGELQLSPTTGTDAVLRIPSLALSDGQVLVAVVDAAGTHAAGFSLRVDGNNIMALTTDPADQLLHGFLRSSGVDFPLAGTGAPGQFWRLRTSPGVGILFETSAPLPLANQAEFDVVTEAEPGNMFAYTQLDLELVASGADGTSRIERIEVTDQPEAGWCDVAELTDEFQAAQPSRWRTFIGGPVNVRASGGELVIDMASAGAGDLGGLVSASRFDLRDSAIQVEVATPPTEPNVAMIFQASLSDLDRVAFEIRDNNIIAQSVIGGTVEQTQTGFNAEAHSHLRLRHDGESLFWEASGDGDDPWAPLRTEPAPFELGTVEIWLFGRLAASATVGEVVRFGPLGER